MWLPQSQLLLANYDVNLSIHPCDHVKGIERGYISQKACFLHQIVSFLEIVAPPMDENGIVFGFLLKPSPTKRDSNLGWIGHSVHVLWQFLSNRPLPLTSKGDYGLTIRDFKNLQVLF